ncbi:hypothetical protein Bca52824_040547 [Brassica carinata]|uniref:Uncharacterized protein n=1 Tax=Brassica carinata TaxID=52824 RepID=A0A8X7RTM9_BRACI|nr:hypothetical protein Bca52824_040547 [Brassica carinata]
MGLDYSYSQPSESEDYGGNDSSDTEDREVEDLIRRDQAELNYNYAATVQYPPQPEYHKMTDPYYKEMKHHKREYDWVSNCVYANYKIPKKCICGGAITVEADDRGRNYYVCKDFKNDGLHIRHECLTALEEELDCLRSQYAEEPRQNDRRKRFLRCFIVGVTTQQQLILLAKAGLKEEIRDGLETEEFATLEALFEEAEEVEEGLKETPPSNPGKRRRTSPDHNSCIRSCKAEKKGDPEDEGYGYPGEGDTGLKDDEEVQMDNYLYTKTDSKTSESD